MTRIVPKLSASLLIVDTGGSEPRFLFGRRHARHVFMPNRYVFPGGRVDADDARVTAPIAMNGFDRSVVALALNRRNALRGAEAIALCAIREAWEEAGHMYGQPHAFEAKQSQWQEFVNNRLAPDPSSLRLLARAITPAALPRRYDAWFFIAFRHAIALSVDVCGPDSELDHQIWASEEETIAFDLPSITRMVLREAVQRLQADPDLKNNEPVPMFAARGGRTSRKLITR